jgi:hypothetical protein
MKKKYIILLSIIVICSYLFMNNSSYSQWQPDFRLTNNPASSSTSLNNAWCVASSSNTVHVFWKDNRLYQNHPNPFNPTTKIRFSIPGTPLNPPFDKGGTERSSRGLVKLTIYNILGKEVTTLVNEQLSPGTYEVEWSSGLPSENAYDYSSGVYYYQLKTNEFFEIKKC